MRKKATFTRGRWRAAVYETHYTVYAEEPSGSTVLIDHVNRDPVVLQECWDMHKVNAHLKAAAPDMLEALEADEAAYQHAFSCEKCSAGRFGVFCEEGAEMKHKAQRMRLAAIAKARGQ